MKSGKRDTTAPAMLWCHTQLQVSFAIIENIIFFRLFFFCIFFFNFVDRKLESKEPILCRSIRRTQYLNDSYLFCNTQCIGCYKIQNHKHQLTTSNVYDIISKPEAQALSTFSITVKKQQQQKKKKKTQTGKIVFVYYPNHWLLLIPSTSCLFTFSKLDYRFNLRFVESKSVCVSIHPGTVFSTTCPICVCEYSTVNVCAFMLLSREMRNFLPHSPHVNAMKTGWSSSPITKHK